MKKLQPSLVLIKVDPVEEQSKEGYYISEEWKELPPTGIVQQVGGKVTFCKVGERVFFERYGAVEVPGDKDLRLCRDDQIFGVL